MPIESRIKVAVAQMDCQLGNLKHNLEIHLELIEQARSDGVGLLMFPELSLTGYRLGDRTPDLALHREDPLILRLAAAAQGIDVLFGFVEEGAAAQIYNAMAVVRDGRLTYVHRKVNLPTYGQMDEGKLFAGGRYIETFPVTGPWYGGVLICADLWNPALVHLAMLHGASLLLAPVNSALGAVGGQFSNPDGWKLVLSFYAMMYGLPVLMANRYGQEGDAFFWGGSQILDPYGKVLAVAPEGYVGLVAAELSYADVRHARFQLPTVRDSNLHLVQREIHRLADRIGMPNI
ncbi:MAG: nitrilase [Candidimonas sp.]|nr:MAG: nitrilase [Candidimonas sp.]TAM19806.1 MAG: nitrilase [Candidimonas sp.]TAM79023.1 MAG: nitrilase [Candidimonas sp.]